MAEKQATLWLKIKSTGEDIIDKISGGMLSLSSVVNVAAAAFAAMSAVVIKSIAEYKEKESALKELTTTMINNGMYSSELKQKYEEQAEAISKLTLFEDDQIIKSQSVIQQMIGQREVSKELTMAIADLAQAKGKSLTEAAEMVGKAISGGRNALAAYGIEVSDSATKTEKMQTVIEGLSQKFGGQAEAATQGLGSITMMSKAFNDMFEAIGERLAPTIVKLTNVTAEYVNKITEWVKGTDQIGKTDEEMTKNILESRRKIIEIEDKIAEKRKAGITGYLGEEESMLQIQKQRLEELLEARDDYWAEEILRMEEANTKKAGVRAAEQADEDTKLLEKLIKDEQFNQELIVNQEKFALVRLQTRQKEIDEELKQTTDAKTKKKLLLEKFGNEELITEQKNAELKKQNTKETLGTIAGMQSSSNKTLAAIGKAAALTQIAIDTPVAVAKAWTLGPIIGPIAAVAVGAAMAAQAAQVAGIQLAEGGIVMPRPGGVQATIAEAGQAEAVIPLDRMGDFGMGGGTNISIVVNGGLMGDQSSAREFAVAIDRELFKLRKNNESVSFEGIVI